MPYVMSVNHFRFEKYDDTLVISSYRDEFEVEYEWPEDLDIRTEDLDEQLHERFYQDALEEYEEYQS